VKEIKKIWKNENPLWWAIKYTFWGIIGVIIFTTIIHFTMGEDILKEEKPIEKTLDEKATELFAKEGITYRKDVSSQYVGNDSHAYAFKIIDKEGKEWVVIMAKIRIEGQKNG